MVFREPSIPFSIEPSDEIASSSVLNVFAAETMEFDASYSCKIKFRSRRLSYQSAELSAAAKPQNAALMARRTQIPAPSPSARKASRERRAPQAAPRSAAGLHSTWRACERDDVIATKRLHDLTSIRLSQSLASRSLAVSRLVLREAALRNSSKHLAQPPGPSTDNRKCPNHYRTTAPGR